jgi:hypothetical protein
MILHPLKGRPFGGRSFIVNKRILIIRHEFINRYLATLSCNDDGNKISIVACYLPFDNGTQLNLSEFNSCLQVAYELLKFFKNINQTAVIIGDFNADLLRNKRFDVIFDNFIKNNNLLLLSFSRDHNLFSYMNGDYRAKLDHCLTSSDSNTFTITESEYLDDDINLSDHKPVLIKLKWNHNNVNEQTNNYINCNNIITLPPNFDNEEIKDKFNKLIFDDFENYINMSIIDINNKQLIIDTMYCQLTTSIKSAYLNCSRVVSSAHVKKNKIWFTKDLFKIKNQMLSIRFKSTKSIADLLELKSLKKSFKDLMKKNIFLYEKNQYFKIGNLIKAKSGVNFFKNVNAFLNKDKKIELQMDQIVAHYDNIFNESLNIDLETLSEVNAGISDIIFDNFTPIEVNTTELNYALKNTNSSKVVGDDGLSSYMILNINQSFVISKILFFFQFIFKHGVIPVNFNNIHIVPIVKDKNKSSNDLANLRPISISNTLAQIFERITKLKLPQLGNTHQNQFGYKNKTSCTHALFAFKELAIKCIENKQHLFAMKLDAVKAFDRLWRDSVFFKVKQKVNFLSMVILLKIYYDGLQARVKINISLSKLFKLKNGVKQGGVLSGDLFNCSIDDLIIECYNSGFGASFIDIILCILGFCDDLCSFSCSEVELQQLLMICERFARKWGIEFNASKCKFIVFGSRKHDNSTFLLNNIKIDYTDKFKYLGLTFSPNLNMSEFFRDKFQIVKNSFFSLNSFGFKSNGVSPFLQSFVYKSFCISRILYGFEIMTINKKTLKSINIEQNNIFRYITGLSRNSHISDTLRILRVFNIFELYNYMKLIFVKNLKSNFICNSIFNHLLLVNHKPRSLSFMREFKSICIKLELETSYVIENIVNILANYKLKTLIVEDNEVNKIIKECLLNNTDPQMRNKINEVTYAGLNIVNNNL